MARLNWGTVGERFYETGTDRGVLYLAAQPGVPWNGLTAVKEVPTGGEPTPFYADGFKYANIASAEEFEATLEAFSSPPEFKVCDGIAQVSNGLFISQQPRKSFGLAYRTLIGNDLEGTDHGYKIHLVYGALSAPSQRDNATINSGVDPVVFSWDITTIPAAIVGHKPSAHFVIDSRTTDPFLLIDLEDILYGSDQLVSEMPSPTELVALFAAPQYTVNWTGTANASPSELWNGRTGVLLRKNIVHDPKTPSGGTGGTGSVSSSSTVTDARFRSGTATSRIWTTGPSSDSVAFTSAIATLNVVLGDIYLIQGTYELVGTLQSGTIQIRFAGADLPTTLSSGVVDNGNGTMTAWRVVQYNVVPGANPSVSLISRPSNGAEIRASDFLIQKLSAPITGPLPFFCGDVLPAS